ncbi:hypothetical protein B0H16DRAFT_1459474 [Mycena metata]|uniref:Uncharacterized protein n=1 Tax=Mycena metata TaxID=1033252 RepID=A0AAD7NA39_9AGAR|nr:hypothetical protein B0H16DRAFT_1459474 [Mycena metata]
MFKPSCAAASHSATVSGTKGVTFQIYRTATELVFQRNDHGVEDSNCSIPVQRVTWSDSLYILEPYELEDLKVVIEHFGVRETTNYPGFRFRRTDSGRHAGTAAMEFMWRIGPQEPPVVTIQLNRIDALGQERIEATFDVPSNLLTFHPNSQTEGDATAPILETLKAVGAMRSLAPLVWRNQTVGFRGPGSQGVVFAVDDSDANSLVFRRQWAPDGLHTDAPNKIRWLSRGGGGTKVDISAYDNGAEVTRHFKLREATNDTRFCFESNRGPHKGTADLQFEWQKSSWYPRADNIFVLREMAKDKVLWGHNRKEVENKAPVMRTSTRQIAPTYGRGLQAAPIATYYGKRGIVQFHTMPQNTTADEKMETLQASGALLALARLLRPRAKVFFREEEQIERLQPSLSRKQGSDHGFFSRALVLQSANVREELIRAGRRRLRREFFEAPAPPECLLLEDFVGEFERF